jgi:hypothetical protein
MLKLCLQVQIGFDRSGGLRRLRSAELSTNPPSTPITKINAPTIMPTIIILLPPHKQSRRGPQ